MRWTCEAHGRGETSHCDIGCQEERIRYRTHKTWHDERLETREQLILQSNANLVLIQENLAHSGTEPLKHI